MPLTWDEFEKVEMRVGTVLEVNDFPKARVPAFQLTVDFGEDVGVRKSSAQVTKFYEREQIVGRQVIAVVNFPPKQIANFMSECLVLGLIDGEGGVILLGPERKVPNGLRVA